MRLLLKRNSNISPDPRMMHLCILQWFDKQIILVNSYIFVLYTNYVLWYLYFIGFK